MKNVQQSQLFARAWYDFLYFILSAMLALLLVERLSSLRDAPESKYRSCFLSLIGEESCDDVLLIECRVGDHEGVLKW